MIIAIICNALSKTILNLNQLTNQSSTLKEKVTLCILTSNENNAIEGLFFGPAKITV